MTGRTHLAVGIASAFILTKPSNIQEFTVCMGAASIGAMVCDIDVSTSKSHKTVNKLITITSLVGIVTCYMEYRWKIGIISSFENHSNILRLLLGMLLFLAICTFGKEQPHRSFMHSFMALGILSACVYSMFPMATKYFAVSMLSHMIIDLMNYKKVHLFYPMKGGMSLKLCHASGFVDTYVGLGAMMICILECMMFFGKIS